MNQERLAAAVGVSRVSVSSYERDAVEPNFTVVCSWGAATGVPLAFFAETILADGHVDPVAPFRHAVRIQCKGQRTLPWADAYAPDPDHVVMDWAA